MHSEDNLLRLLILGTSQEEAESLLNVLRKGGYGTRPRLVPDLDSATDALAEGGWDLILASDRLGPDGLDVVLPVLAEQNQDIPIIALCPEPDEDVVVGALEAGAKDCVQRDHTRHLIHAVHREFAALSHRRARRQCEASLRENQRRNSELLETSEAAVAYVLDGVHIHANKAYRGLIGVDDPAELADLTLMDLVAAEEREGFRGFLRRLAASDEEMSIPIPLAGDGVPYRVTMTFTPSSYEGEACHQVVLQCHRPEAEPPDDAGPGQDSLTGLADHHELLKLLEARQAEAVSSQRRTCLLYAEIDDYAAVRGRLGITSSYDLVRDLAELFREELGDEPALARCGDAAFAVVADGSDPRVAETLSQRLLDAASQHILELKGQSVAVTCSVGSTLVTELTPTGKVALDWAAKACRGAAAEGGNRHHHHKPVEATDTGNYTHAARGAALLQALEQDTLRLLFQPVVSLHGLTTPIYRAMPSMGLNDDEALTGEDLLTVAEDHDLAGRLDQWVAEQVLKRLAEHQKRLERTLFMVQLTDAAMANEPLVLAMGKALRAHGLDAGRLVFELSETAALTRIKAARGFSSGVHQFGCGTAITYFGSGLNPFKLLDHVDAEYLILDGSFTTELLTSEANRATVEKMHQQAQRRGKFTIAPGVRDANTLALVWQCGVDYASGDYLQEPAEEMSFDFSEVEQL